MDNDFSENQGSTSLFKPGENCWRVETATEIALIVDADSYFKMLRKVIAKSEQQLLLIGWDFDLEIEMLPGESDENGIAPDGHPNQLGPFIEAIIDQKPDLHIYMLKWNGAFIAAPGRLFPTAKMAAFGNSRIHFALDGHHPFGACHHQKIVVADDTVAFCGGIDATEDRWDTPEHLPDDPRRVRKDGTPSAPWHDTTSAVSGPAAAALGELSRRRWCRATGETIATPEASAASVWPDDLNVDASDVEVSIARTEPPYDGQPLVNEIEKLFLDSIKAAQRTIYVESQYFAAMTIIDLLEERLQEENGPEIIIINPQAALSQFEDDAMHALRDRLLDRLKAADTYDRFRIYYPVTTADDPIYVHSKVMIIDTNILHLGSANLNDRSLGFDTECNLSVRNVSPLIPNFLARLVSEHLGVPQSKFSDLIEEKKSLIETVEALNSCAGRGLRPIGKRPTNARAEFLADTRLMDRRYQPGEVTKTGQGVRPRHVLLAGCVAAVVYVGWLSLLG